MKFTTKPIIPKFIIAAVCAVAALCLAACGKAGDAGGIAGTSEPPAPSASAEPPQSANPDATVLTFRGEAVPADELRLFMFLQNSDDKSAALDYLLYALASLQKADELGLTLSAEEAAQAGEDTAALKSMVEEYGLTPFSIPDERITELMGAGLLADKLFELNTADFRIDEEAFETDFADYLANGERYYTEVTFNYIFCDALEEAQAAQAAMAGGMSFDDAVKAYSEDYDEEEGVRVIDLRAIDAGDLAEALLALEPGETTDALEFGGGYIIVRALTHRLPPEDEIRADFAESYKTNARYEAYAEIVDGWLNDAHYEVNQDAFDTFTIY